MRLISSTMLCVSILVQINMLFAHTNGAVQTAHAVTPSSTNGLYTLNKLIAIIYHPEEKSYILQSDIRPSIDGRPRDLEQVVFERLAILDAKRFKQIVTDAEVDRALAQVQKHKNMSREDLLKFFKKLGFTEEEAREELRSMLLYEMIVDYKVKGKVLVSKKEIETHHKSNPTYILSQAFIPYARMSLRSIQKAKIQESIESGDILKAAPWGDTFELRAEDIADDKAYIKELKAGTVRIVTETEAGITVLHHKGNKELTKEYEQTIALRLQGGKLTQALNDYSKELLDTARIKYINPKNTKSKK